MNGTNATELPTFANDIRKKDVSHKTARAANATTPFQLAVDDPEGNVQPFDTNSQAVAAVTAATRP